MSEEWLEYLRENAPDLYEQAVASRKHDTKWRDNYIRDLEAQLARLVEGLEIMESGMAAEASDINNVRLEWRMATKSWQRQLRALITATGEGK